MLPSDCRFCFDLCAAVRGPLLWLSILLLMLAGCSAVNFSANYYSLPPECQPEIEALWRRVTTELPLTYAYRISILDQQHSKKLKGVPAISGQTLLVPEDFIRSAEDPGLARG